jgi:hypothetical protein
MILNGGFFWQQGQKIKNFGDRMAAVRILGIPVLFWCCGLVICLGYKIRDLARNMPINSI